MHLAAAFRTGNPEDAEVAGDGVLLECFGPVHNPLRHLGNAGHERRPAELPPLDLPQPKFPITGQLRLREFLDTQATEQFHQGKSLGDGL
ncbi:MAG: hypothetical protein BWX84_01720 [Verrucomicrobia bacterium ADurb.Bin118]|nr:MAG: hypothetical protein BWX84_01720 [Verrucomicrobia bacterium ADurb.Bin118]